MQVPVLTRVLRVDVERPEPLGVIGIILVFSDGSGVRIPFFDTGRPDDRAEFPHLAWHADHFVAGARQVPDFVDLTVHQGYDITASLEPLAGKSWGEIARRSIATREPRSDYCIGRVIHTSYGGHGTIRQISAGQVRIAWQLRGTPIRTEFPLDFIAENDVGPYRANCHECVRLGGSVR